VSISSPPPIFALSARQPAFAGSKLLKKLSVVRIS